MSKILLTTENLGAVASPSVGNYILAVDTDGLLKLKRQTDTVTLGLTGSLYVSTHQVTYSEFKTLLDTSSLNTGDVYVITNFKTRHYIQYTDTTGDGTSGSETVNVGTSEQICVLATSVNTYDNRVRSTSYSDDIIIWEHSISDREYDHAGGVSSTGHILYRKSVNGNERDYDFRKVKFRRWNDGSGNYIILRKVDAPVPGDYIDVSSHDEDYHFNNKVGSSFTQSGSIYYMDNMVFATPSYVSYNTIKRSTGGNITSSTFSNNTIGEIINSQFLGDIVTNNTIVSSTNATFSYLSNNNFGIILDSSLGTASNNDIKSISDSNITILSSNEIISVSQSTITYLTNNKLNVLSLQNSTTISDNKGGSIIDNTSLNISNNTFNELRGNTASAIMSNITDQLITNNLTGEISNNTVNVLSTNWMIGNILHNKGYKIFLNQTNGDISKNDAWTIEYNAGTGSISDNKSNMISSNSILGDILSNKVVSIISNTHNASFSTSDINYNVGRLIATNSVGNITKNIIDEISLNTNGDISGNRGSILTMNHSDIIDNNDSYQIIGNTSSNLFNNISYDISYNTGEVISNKVESITLNSSDVVSNIGTTISSNTSLSISYNKVNEIESNTVTHITKNIGDILTSNTSTSTSSISYNVVREISSNTGVETISSNRGDNISSNINTYIIDNDVINIYNNNASIISNNKGAIIENNSDVLSNGGIISNNNVTNISNNINTSEISYNAGNVIGSNTFLKDNYYGATAGFTFTGGSPSIGDMAIITLDTFTIGVISTTTSPAGFMDEIFSFFPQYDFSATYSGLNGLITEPTSVISYQGSTFSIDIVGTYSISTNTSFSGSGINDILLDTSAYTTSSATHYLILIDGTGANDKFAWLDDKGNSASNISITGGSYNTLSYGMKVAFANTTGHVLSDNWDFDVLPNQSTLSVTHSSIFNGELILSNSEVKYNNVNTISGNYYSSINNNVANEISGNLSSGYNLSDNTTGDIINANTSLLVRYINKSGNIFSVSNQGIEIGKTSSGTVVGNLVIDNNNLITTEEYVHEILTLSSYVIPISNSREEYYGASSSTTLTITLPETSTLQNGKKIIIKDESGNASVNNVTINTWTASFMDGATSSVISSNYGGVSLIKSGNNWFII
jgi:hypothetical protein